MVVFSKKHKPAKFPLILMGKTITHSMSSQYLGVWFDSKCTWGKHIVYLIQKCQKRINFMRTITGTWWGAHPEDLIRLYQTTILSVLEYGSFCFQSAVKTHLLKLQRVQYRCLRIALGCMNSTHTMSLEVLAGVQPLTDRFAQLSFRFFIRCEVLNPLVIENFEKLLEQNPQTRFMSVYYWYMTLEVSPSPVNTNRDNFSDFDSSSVDFDLSMRDEITGIPESFRSIGIPQIFASKFGHVSGARQFFTDGSKADESTGFGVYSEFHSATFMLRKPCSVYIAELAAIYYPLEYIRTLPPEHYFIFTDSLSSLEAVRSMKPMKHSVYFLNGIRQVLSALSKRSYIITIAWVPSHCSIPGNEKADSLAKVGASEGDVYERQIAFDDFFCIGPSGDLDQLATQMERLRDG
ncbi:uncharacterized protein LOC134287117 [Aedes albopictus]|uniref:RNase H type-1 domain-containing protein n=1 Tax=Aedes albopictus TaxID=7160 RepID=A0ABM1ZXH5_AEDAL